MAKKTIAAGEEVAKAMEPNSVDQADAAGTSSEATASPAASEAPQLKMAAGTNSTDTPESEGPQGGSVDPDAPAEQDRMGLAPHHGDRAGYVDNAKTALKALEAGDLDAATAAFDAAKAEFSGKFPCVAAAIDAWQADGNTKEPTGIRIAAKRDGFRRAGVAHSKTPSEYPLDRFNLPEQLEQLLAEPNLTVEFI